MTGFNFLYEITTFLPLLQVFRFLGLTVGVVQSYQKVSNPILLY